MRPTLLFHIVLSVFGFLLVRIGLQCLQEGLDTYTLCNRELGAR